MPIVDRAALLRCLLRPESGIFGRREADDTAEGVVAGGTVGELYRIAAEPLPELSAVDARKVRGRAAHVLERLWEDMPWEFEPFAERFCRQDFVACTHAGARRSFAKIMAGLLAEREPDTATLEPIATAAAEWAADPRTKPGTKVWAMEILKLSRPHLEWVAELWEDMVALQLADASPSLLSRHRNHWPA